MASSPLRGTACANFRQSNRPDRREILRVGGLMGMGLFLPQLYQAQASGDQPADAGRSPSDRSPSDRGPSDRSPSATYGRARSVIMMYLHGGHAQQETWDPKPDAPSPACGEFKAIATSLPGVRVSEVLPRAATILHKLAVIRSLSHGNANHVQASLPAMTGHHHPDGTEARGDFPPSPTDFPAFGAVLSQLRAQKQLPTWVQVGPLMRRNNGTVLHGQSPGFLGAKYSPLVIDQDLLPPGVRVEAVSPDPDTPLLRLTSRRNLLAEVDTQRRMLDAVAEVRTLDAYHQKAFNLLSSQETARAFDLAAESAATRERYGKTQFGQCCLLARRLAEAGVPLINVHFCRTPNGSWDTHGKHFTQMRDYLCPIFDQAFTALVEDLDERGLLDRTVVQANAEFGRTPRVNTGAGRDHWPFVYSIAQAGGGFRRGVVYGASDKIAAYPTANAHDPRDLAATLYHLLGVPDTTTLYDQTHRPHRLVEGQKIDGLLG